MENPKHRGYDEIRTRYAYILYVYNRGDKSKFYGMKKCLYTGQTDNLVRRYKEHLAGRNSEFLRNYFPNAQKRLVFVQTVEGTEYDSIGVEWEIKKMGVKEKEELIKSEKNQLVSYIPLKAIILRVGDEEVALRF